MKTAEEIIQEYLDRGYGPESLRILAESREEPLGGQMLAILDRLEAAAPLSAAGEESAPAEVSCDEAVFFVADDDGAADGESVDFDLMAETRTGIPETPAAAGESVADIVIGETAGADMVAYKTEAVDAVEPEEAAAESAASTESGPLSIISESAETGIWSRLWSKMAQSAPAPAPSAAEERAMAAALEVAPEPLFEEVEEEAARPFFGEYVAEPVDEEEEPRAEAPAAVMEEPVVEEMIAEEAVAEEPVAEEAAEEIVEAPVPEEAESIAASAEISADYIPGSVTGPVAQEEAAEERVEEQPAAESAAEAVEEPVAEVAEELVAEEAALPEPVAEAEQADEQPAENNVSRREKRRRERLEKKKARRGRKNAAAELPEIVLTHSGESGTLVPEAAEIVEPAEPVEPAEVAETAEAAEPEMESVAAEAEEQFAPLVAPGTLAALSVHSFAFAASLAALSQEELARAAEIIGQDRLAAQMIEQNNLEAALENEAEAAEAALEDGIVDESESASGSVENNVILFRDKFPVFAGATGDGEESMEDAADESPLALFEDEESACFAPFLRMLSAPESEESEVAAIAEPAEVAEELPGTVEELQDEAREAAEEIVEEEAVPPVEEAAPEQVEEALEEPAALADAPAGDSAAEPALPESALAREAALRLRLEDEYQARLDAFAARLLEAQAAAAAHENRVAEKKAELDARGAVLEEMRKRLESGEEQQRDLLRRLDESAAAAQAKDAELARCTKTREGLREEHARLYTEFEDLRKAYNEVVTDVMPGLQSERDDLAMTVERQCAKERTLRTSLASSRKRLAAGYILGAAACLMLVTLPVANWLRSGDDNRKLAVDHQLFSELRETLDVQVQQNVDAQTRIVELERKITRARDEISKLDGRNRELAGLAAAQHSQGIAVFKPDEASASGTPTRAMTMALQATVPPGGKLHVNEVMDPAGSIEQLAMENSARNAENARTRMAMGDVDAGAALPVSALVRTDAGSGSLRPQAQAQGRASAAARPPKNVRPAAVAVAPAADPATVTAKVKKGEGVAQVVYRVLNTRDPDVIAWVIQENKIRNDRRGNPLIQPNQELRLPKDGRIGQAASAAGLKRR